MPGAHLFPRCDLSVVPDTRSIRLAAGLTRNVCPLGDEERAGDAAALLVVLDTELRRDVRVVIAVPGQGGEHDPVSEGDIAHLDRLEECRSRHAGDRVVCAEGTLLDVGNCEGVMISYGLHRQGFIRRRA